MKPTEFESRLREVRESRGTDLALLIAPRLPKMPLPLQAYDDPFLPFGKAVIDSSRDLVCAYVFDLASYLALGAAGAVALERTIAYAGSHDSTLTILHGPFVGSAYAQGAGRAAFNVDAVTLASSEDANAYSAVGLGVFVSGGILAAGLISLGGTQVRLAGEDSLYAGRGEDFAQRVRGALQAYQR